jgi:hypothetical protein
MDIQLAYTTAPMQRGSLAIRRPLCSRAAIFMCMCEDGGRWQSFFFLAKNRQKATLIQISGGKCCYASPNFAQFEYLVGGWEGSVSPQACL